jgi:hypothetical protein
MISLARIRVRVRVSEYNDKLSKDLKVIIAEREDLRRASIALEEEVRVSFR